MNRLSPFFMQRKSSLDFQEACREVRLKFPTAFGPLSACAPSAAEEEGARWAASLPERPGLHQVLCPVGADSGSLELLLALVEETGRRGIRMVWIDPADSLDPQTAFSGPQRHLLWARGGGLQTALRVADTVARDENFPFVCLDGAMVAADQWKRVPLGQWYRLQRLVRHHCTSLILCSPSVSIPSVGLRWSVRRKWDFESLFDRNPGELLASIRVEDAGELSSIPEGVGASAG